MKSRSNIICERSWVLCGNESCKTEIIPEDFLSKIIFYKDLFLKLWISSGHNFFTLTWSGFVLEECTWNFFLNSAVQGVIASPFFMQQPHRYPRHSSKWNWIKFWPFPGKESLKISLLPTLITEFMRVFFGKVLLVSCF